MASFYGKNKGGDDADIKGAKRKLVWMVCEVGLQSLLVFAKAMKCM